jgi:glycerol-3-phosphate acyltransferase PlsY
MAEPQYGIATGQFLLALSFLGCVVGHIYSPWLKFHGGKGIAVAVGALFLVLGVGPALIELALFAVLVIATRYVSVGSIAAAVLCPFIALYLFWGNTPAVITIDIAAVLVIFAHRQNISRLLAHNENRIGSKKEKQES